MQVYNIWPKDQKYLRLSKRNYGLDLTSIAKRWSTSKQKLPRSEKELSKKNNIVQVERN